MRSPWRGPSRAGGGWSERMSRYSQIPPKERLPDWIRTPIGAASALESVQAVVKQQRLHTIC